MMSETLKFLWGIPGILTFISGVATFFYARWRYSRDRQFSRVSDETRIQVLKQIRKLWPDTVPEDIKRAEIKALYERIGLTFQIEINRLLINFMEQEGISYRNIRAKYFLRCRDVMKTTSTSFYFSIDNARRDKQIFATLPVVVAIIMGAAYGFTQMSFASTPDFIAKIFIIFYALLWLVIAYLGLNEWQKMTNGALFWQKLSPYLQQHGIETADSYCACGEL